MMKLAHVKTFLAVVDEGGFREAARSLMTSQPTVTQHIKKLEETLGVRLVKRSHANCLPTAYGNRFLPHARRLISAAEEAREATKHQRFAVGASSNIGTYLLQPRLKTFISANGADEHMSVHLGANLEIANQLSRGELDVALMEWWDDRPGFNATVWRREPLVVIVPPGHSWAKCGAVSEDHLFSTPLIGGEPGSGTSRLLHQVYGSAADRLHVSMSLGSTAAVINAVRAGMGISIVLESAAREESASGLLCALPIVGQKLIKDIFLLAPEDLPPDTTAGAFANFLMENNGTVPSLS